MTDCKDIITAVQRGDLPALEAWFETGDRDVNQTFKDVEGNYI
jgi:hypothetical protein